MRRSPRCPTTRRRFAVMACLVWLLGVELLPNLHLATHARLPAHDHGGDAPPGDELVIRVHRDTTAASLHAHDGALHAHGPRAPMTDRDGVAFEGAAPPRDPGHGDHSLAHRALAHVAPPPPIVHPLPVDHHVVPVAHAVARLVAIAPPPDAAARAPPA